VNLRGLDSEAARALVYAAHRTGRYSKTTRGNIDIVTNLVQPGHLQETTVSCPTISVTGEKRVNLERGRRTHVSDREMAGKNAIMATMAICIGDVMAALETQDHCAHLRAGAIAPGNQLIDACIAGAWHEEPEPGPEEWRSRMRTLQQYVCELLIKNQQLRMSLESTKAAAEQAAWARNVSSM
jgi:hypothetical protein